VSRRDFDVLVLGGGLTGLAFGLLLGRQAGRLRIGILEAGPAPQPVSEATGLRVVAVSQASRAILEYCGAWNRLPGHRTGPYQRMVVWQHEGSADGRRCIAFDAAEQGVGELGYILENELLRGALWQAARDCPSLELLPGLAPTAVRMDAGGVSVQGADGAVLDTRLVVGADGQDSWLRAQAGVVCSGHAYGQRALIAHVDSEKPHQQTAWQRFLPDGPLALLPLADGRSSVVWSCADARARLLADENESSFNAALTAASGGVLGALRLTTPRAGFSLAAQQAMYYTGMRFALIGDAAHRVHPLAGQGVNLGFLDAAALAEKLADHLASPHADPGDPLALRRYERWRRGEVAITMAAMEALHMAFTSPWPGVAQAAGAGLAFVNRLSPVKTRLADYAMGRRGDLPGVVHAARLD